MTPPPPCPPLPPEAEAWAEGSGGVCGFGFGRNLTQLNYPVEAAVGSVLPLCQRFIFAVGASDDDTRERVTSIDTSMMNGGRGGTVEILETRWPAVQVDGEVLAIEANKAMAEAERIAAADGLTWGLYIQSDEVLHEGDLERVAAGMRRWKTHPDVKALLFRYLHFVLDYQTIDPWMYHKASRVVRLDGSCRIFGDACGPGLIQPPPAVLKINDGYLDKKHLGRQVRWARDGGKPARIFHYGWVKTRAELETKFEMVDRLWWGTLDEAEKSRRKQNKFGPFIERYASLKKFRGAGPRRTHPALMAQRIAGHPVFREVGPRWLQPGFYGESLRHGLRL